MQSQNNGQVFSILIISVAVYFMLKCVAVSGSGPPVDEPRSRSCVELTN